MGALKGQVNKIIIMAQSLSKLYIHIIFHIKNTSTPIRKEDKECLFAYIGSIIKDNGSSPILINGTCDHLHILCVMSKNIALSKLTEEIKRHSSRWIKTRGKHYNHFGWQGGYAGFSVSNSLLDKTILYIKNQEKHHIKMNFKDELTTILQKNEVDFNEKYLWTD